MARVAKPREPERAVRRNPGTASKGQWSDRIALARGPLGIVLAALFLVEAVMGLIVGWQLAPAQATFLTYSMVLLAFGTLGGFFFVWIKYPGILYPPDQFRDEANWVAAVGRQDVVASEPMPLPSMGHPPDQAANAVPVTPKGPLMEELTVELQEGSVTSTGIFELKKYLKNNASDWAYLIVDVGEGKTWLLSRLFIFAVMYRSASAQSLRCIVLVRSERLLGIADSAKICNVLASRYPWFNTTLATALTTRSIPIFGQDAIDEREASYVMEEFIGKLRTSEDRTGDQEWSQLSSGKWEHSRWLTADVVRADLSGALFDPKAAFLSRSEGTSDEDFAIEIMSRDSPFVAEIGENGEFRKLYDKKLIFDRMMNRLRERAQAA